MFARSALDVDRKQTPPIEETVVGRRCGRCGGTSALALRRCPRCEAPMHEARFGPEGTVWSSTVVHLEGTGPAAPYQLAYLDLDQGPRLLVCVEGDGVAAIGSRLRLRGSTEAGAPIAVSA